MVNFQHFFSGFCIFVLRRFWIPRKCCPVQSRLIEHRIVPADENIDDEEIISDGELEVSDDEFNNSIGCQELIVSKSFCPNQSVRMIQSWFLIREV